MPTSDMASTTTGLTPWEGSVPDEDVERNGRADGEGGCEADCTLVGGDSHDDKHEEEGEYDLDTDGPGRVYGDGVSSHYADLAQQQSQDRCRENGPHHLGGPVDSGVPKR